VALAGAWGMVGAPRTSVGTVQTGAVYVVDNLDDCDGGGTIDYCDLIDGRAHDCNGDRIVDACEIAAVPDLDADGSGVLDTCEFAGDLDGDGVVTVNDVCQWHVRPIDVNADGVIDAVDLKETIKLAGSFTDCNTNLIPDHCEGVQPVARVPIDDPDPVDDSAPTAITAGYLVVGSPRSVCTTA
jgi:hypothetical protein